MKRKSTYKELEQRVIQLENESPERKPAEEALRESEEKLRTFMDSVADFFAVTDKNENLIYVNRSMAEALGHAKLETSIFKIEAPCSKLQRIFDCKEGYHL
ncbi:MAG: PAS domain S-box protein [Desulfobacterales bacterium]|nr:MAG: PAS domain S-box protein [Desulfobacterales bacterium]